MTRSALALMALVLAACAGEPPAQTLPAELQHVVDIQRLPHVPRPLIVNAAREIAADAVTRPAQANALKAHLALLGEAATLADSVVPRSGERVALIGSIATALAAGIPRGVIVPLIAEGGRAAPVLLDRTVAVVGTGIPAEAAVLIVRQESG